METKDKQPILNLAKRYAEKHQIIYSDYHIRLTEIVIAETIRTICKQLSKQETVYDMDLYKDQVPLKDDDSIEVYQ
jgi:hypothetical protein